MVYFPNFWWTKSFIQKLQLCHAQLHKGLYHHAKIQRNLIQQILVSCELNKWPYSFLTTPTQKSEITLSFPEFAPACKKLLHSIHLFLSTHFLQCPPKTFLISFYYMWICINMQEIRLFYWLVLEIWLIKKILQSDWLRTIWPVSQKPKFSQIWDLCRNTGNNHISLYK